MDIQCKNSYLYVSRKLEHSSPSLGTSLDVILRCDLSSLSSSYFNYETVMWKSFMFFE